MLVGLLVFGSIGLVWFGGFQLWYRRAVATAEGARNWPTAPGEVVTAMLLAQGSRVAPVVVYTYEVEGRSYRGNRIRFGGASGLSVEAGRNYAERYHVGANVEVRFNPAKPGQSVLEPGAPSRALHWVSFVGLLFPLLSVLIFLLSLASGR